MLTDKKISVVIICYNDGGSVREMYRRVTEAMQDITPNYEIVYVNDASPDDAYVHLSDLAARDPRLVVITHTRNFGSQNAYTSGLEYCTGDAAITLDGDIQDPPEMFGELVKKWLEGYDIVYGIRAKRKGSLIRRFFYKVFYRVFALLSSVKMPLDASDFALLDRKVIDQLNRMPESGRFIRGMRAWTGFKSFGIPYLRAERYSGRTNLSFFAYIRWAKLAIFSFSERPLEWITYMAGFVTVLAGIGIIVYIPLSYYIPGPRGYLTILVAVLFLGAIQLLSLSVIGEYISRIFEEVKQRPKYIRREILNDYRGAMNPVRNKAIHSSADNSQDISNGVKKDS